MPMSDQPNCYKCKNFFITWKPQLPYGCHVMEFKSKKLPAQVVFEASGENCLRYEEKSPANERLS